MAYHTDPDHRRTIKVTATTNETPETKTLHFRDRRCAHASPGQYAMLWIPGVDEVPMSLSKTGPGDLAAVTVQRVGEATTAIHSLNRGDRLGLRGPFGKGFTPRKGNSLLVAGGNGLAPLIPLAEHLKRLGCTITLAYGAKTASMLHPLKPLQTLLETGSIIIATEDGTAGVRGPITEAVEELLNTNRFEAVYTCGPEPMMRKVFNLTEKKGLPLQASVERIIKCSIGLCGSCMLGRFRICREGPVLSSEQLREVLDEFGVYTRGFDGNPIRY